MRRCKLGEIADFKNGVNYTKGETKYKYLCVGVTNFQESPILQDFDAISTVTLDNQLTEDFLLQEGDILLVRSNGNKRLIGRSMLIFPEDKVMTYSGFCIRCRITSPTVESKYIFYYLQNALIRGLFAKNQQTNINNISQEVLNNIMVFLPNVEIQRKISNLLFFIDSKIALNNRVNATLEAMAKTIYDYWFVQFDFPDEKGRPYKTSGGKMVYNEELGREIPAGWEVKRVKDLLDVVTGKEDANFSVLNGAYNFFTCSNEVLRCDSPAFGGSAVLLAGNGNFNVKHYTGKFNAYQRTYVLIPNDQKYYAVLYISVQDMVQALINNSNGSIVKFITKSDVENILVIDSPQRKLYECLNNIYDRIEAYTNENRRLAALRDWLLPMLMNGQVGFKKG